MRGTVPQIMYEWEGLKFNLSKGEMWREPIEDLRDLVTRMVNNKGVCITECMREGNGRHGVKHT